VVLCAVEVIEAIGAIDAIESCEYKINQEKRLWCGVQSKRMTQLNQ